MWAVLPRNRRALWWARFLIVSDPGVLADDRGARLTRLERTVVFARRRGLLHLRRVLAFRLWRQRFAWAQTAAKQMRSAEGVEFRFDSVGIALESAGATESARVEFPLSQS